MTRRPRIAVTLGVVLAFLAAGAWFTSRGNAPSGPVVPVAERRPPVALAGTGLRGDTVDVAALRGAPVVLNFWASWCGPCQAEQPALERAAAATRSAGVHFVGVNIRESNQAAARAFLDDYRVSYPSVVDSDFRHSVALGVPAPPATFVLDRAGRVAVRLLGEIPSADVLIELIEHVGREQL